MSFRTFFAEDTGLSAAMPGCGVCKDVSLGAYAKRTSRISAADYSLVKLNQENNKICTVNDTVLTNFDNFD